MRVAEQSRKYLPGTDTFWEISPLLLSSKFWYFFDDLGLIDWGGADPGEAGM
jgi:hypothetical protein